MDLTKFPEEILAEILVRLDVKTLIRSSCVCKTWRVLIIDTPYFGDKHLNHWKDLKNQDDAVVFLRYPRGEVKYELVTFNDSQSPDSPPFLHADLELLFQSTDRNLLVRECNGVICIVEGGNSGSVHLTNLTTLEHLVLPPGLFEDDATYVTENLGFGFDQSSNDYKVVRIKRVRINRTLQVPGRKKRVEVYRVRTNSWTELNVSLPLQDRIRGPGVFLNGFCHWLDHSGKVVTFDFKTERFGEMMMPFNFSHDDNGTIDVLEGSLAVCFRRANIGIALWVMNEYGKYESWTWKCAIDDSLFEPDSYWFHDSRRVVIRYPAHVMVCTLEEQDPSFFEYDCSHLRGTSSTVFRPTLVSLRNRPPLIQS